MDRTCFCTLLHSNFLELDKNLRVKHEAVDVRTWDNYVCEWLDRYWGSFFHLVNDVVCIQKELMVSRLQLLLLAYYTSG